MALLDAVNGPGDLKALSDSELQTLAQEVRELIIDTIGEIGGHFGANLGTCELAVALHSLLDSPRDKIVWDVGHQAYPHKILTGRRDALNTIRTYGGLAPFLSRSESEHDAMGAGHASMSIAPNAGALSRYFNRVRLNPKLWRAREGVEDALTKLLVGIGAALERLGPQFKESLKAFWAPGLWWEELGFAYVGVVDGHDVKALREALGEALGAGRPVVVHTTTVKGKGFAAAEENGLAGMEKWHAAK